MLLGMSIHFFWGAQREQFAGDVAFPVMLSAAALDRRVQTLGGAEVRCRNLWRESDPTASRMGRPPVDAFNGPDGGGLPDPAGRRHSGYWDAPEWDESRAALLGALEGADDG